MANWKMNPATFREARKLFDETKKLTSAAQGVSIVVCPPAIFLRELATGQRAGSKIAFGIQNAHFEERGSFTGEISMPEAKDAKASYVLIGHAERRALGETDEEVRKKVSAAITANITPVLCVGEKSRESGEYYDVVREQLRAGLMAVPEKKVSKVVIAYEPVWAIGAAAAMNPREMHEMAIFIRKTIVERFGDAGHKVTILYGGSIDAKNAADMLQNGDVKGLLVGRASVDAKAFGELVRAVSLA